MDEQQIFQIERPHPSLMKLYFIRSVITGPGIIFSLPILFFRYHTLRYRFDDEGIHMRWGILFRREINLTYARIQDIHLTSGFIQRWLGLADIQIQTASGSSSAEMKIEGLREFKAIRDFLYTKMRGERNRQQGSTAAGASAAPGALDSQEAVALLREIQQELQGARQALEARRGEK
ncbi:PH domain-containing protein [Candidatus Sumerlaeota bacterium]